MFLPNSNYKNEWDIHCDFFLNYSKTFVGFLILPVKLKTPFFLLFISSCWKVYFVNQQGFHGIKMRHIFFLNQLLQPNLKFIQQSDNILWRVPLYLGSEIITKVLVFCKFIKLQKNNYVFNIEWLLIVNPDITLLIW